MLIWSVRILSFAILILTIYATVTIFKSTWFRFWSSRKMDDQEKREFYVKNKYDIKWSLALMGVCLLGAVLSIILGLSHQAGWNLLCAFLFWLLSWGTLKTYEPKK